MRTAWVRKGTVLVSTAACAAVLLGAAISPRSYQKDVDYLASPAMRGRGTGTPELETAAKFIAKVFRKANLKPLEGHSYLQPFRVTTSAELGRDNRLSYTGGAAGETTLALEQDFIPYNFTSSGSLTGELVFAGFGITASEYGYDDYSGIDATGKIVLVLRDEPQEFDESSVFAGRAYTQHAQLFSKAVNAKFHGAKAVILVKDVDAHPTEEDRVAKFSSNAGPDNTGIPFVEVSAAVAGRWFEMAGKNLRDLERAIDTDLRPQSFAFPDSLRLTVSTDVKRVEKTVHNVAGYLPGATPEYIVIGAHYDHLGLGEQFSMEPSAAGTIHPGADDNASGTAGVMELARYYASRPRPKRGILFLAFAGEELGMLGSAYYVGHPLLPLENAVAMINLDMIGRIRDGKVYISGFGTAAMFRPMLEEMRKDTDLNLDFSEQAGYGSSDHTSFTTRQVPVLFFFSGLHSDYHKPGDTPDKINSPQAVKLLQFIAEVTDRLSAGDRRPVFVRLADPRPQGMSGGGGGYGPWFGSVPDFTELPDGYRVADITPGSPADKAGLKAGDIVFEFDGKPIRNLYDFTYALRSKRPGDKVMVKVRRENAIVSATVVLENRR